MACLLIPPITNQVNESRGHGGDLCGLLARYRLSDNVGGVKHFSRTLQRALGEERHFALVDGFAFSNPGSLVISQVGNSVRPIASLRSATPCSSADIFGRRVQGFPDIFRSKSVPNGIHRDDVPRRSERYGAQWDSRHDFQKYDSRPRDGNRYTQLDKAMNGSGPEMLRQ